MNLSSCNIFYFNIDPKEIDASLIPYIKLEMSTLPLMTDCLRLIALQLDSDADISAMSCVCRQFNRAISSNEFWTTKIEKDFGGRFPPEKITTICKRYTLSSARSYYRRYVTTRPVDDLMRTWISKEDLPRFYSAIVRFFRNGGPEKRRSMTKKQRQLHRLSRIHRPSRANDIWIYGGGNTGKSTFVKLLYSMSNGFRDIFYEMNPLGYMHHAPLAYMCDESSNHFFIDLYRPNDNFAGSVFEFRNVFKEYAEPLTNLSRRQIQDYLFVLTTLYG